jgi:hypothetical protein
MVRNVALVLLALAILIGTGLVHAVWTDRWGLPPEYTSAADRLARLPTKLGDWDGEWSEVDGAEYPQDVYGVGVVGRFVNAADGSRVTVYLALGRPGPMTVHTPELCYGGGGFRRAGSEERYETTYGSPARTAGFTHAVFTKASGPVPQHVRVMWSWAAEGSWQAHTTPRFTLARHRLIAKLYLIKPVKGPADALKDDPIVGFIDALLPELDRIIRDRT